MDISTQRKNARKFIEEWKDRGREKQDSQSFWLSLLHNILGVENPEEMIRFEEKVKLTHDSFIDAYIDQTHTMIEQKGANKDLDKAIKQSDGSLLTPYQQAFRYSIALPYSKRPRWIVTCNFKEFRVYDMEHPNSEPTRIELKDLAKDFYQLEFLINKTDEHLEKEKQVSLDAGELVGKIYDELLKQYKDPSNPHSQKSINQLCVRIVFCLYAEDSGIFGRKKMFHDYLKQYDAQHTRLALVRLFKVLDTKIEERDPYLANDDPKLAEFPYVNGGMFSDEDIEIPPFTDELKDLLLNNASEDFDWSQISPTIFGAVFESTLNPETRRQGGMHYTSIENIHKVIDPLFLNNLKDELNDIKKYKQPATLKKKAKAFQDKLSRLTFFDPACGSGNFLTETYLQLRRLENEAIKLQNTEFTTQLKDSTLKKFYSEQTINNTLSRTATLKSEFATKKSKDVIKVSIQQFYGIEINDFAVSVAKTALWIAESQMFEETKNLFFANRPDWKFFPLDTNTYIHEGDALKMDWNKVLPSSNCRYILGNPPFIGGMLMSRQQKAELKNVLGNIKGIGKVDYVSGWYKKAIDYIKNTEIEVAFVSTNSICQGEQVATLWKPFLATGIHINFAYRTFIWNSEAKGQKAHVHCIIIGFSYSDKPTKLLFNESGNVSLVHHISPYLTDMKDIFVTSRQLPLNAPHQMKFGSMPRDGGGFILNEEQRIEFIKKNPLSQKYIHFFLGASEFLHNKKRYCLWLNEATPKELKKMPLVLKRIQQVKDFRERSKAISTRKMAETPSFFAQIAQPQNGNYIAIPRVSSELRKYIPMGFFESSVIAGDSLLIIPNASLYEFGILESNVHMAWMRAVAGRLESRYRYSKDIVYNGFPFPSPTDKQKAKIEKTAKEILDARALYPDSSLADLYDPLTQKPELLKAHQNNDRAVMQAYGLSIKDTTESDAVAHLFKMYEKLIKNEK